MWHHHLNKLYLHTSKNYLCAKSKNSVERVLEKKIIKGLCKMCYVQIVFGYYFYDNVGSSNISEFCSVVLEKPGASVVIWVQNMCNVTILPGAGITV